MTAQELFNYLKWYLEEREVNSNICADYIIR